MEKKTFYYVYGITAHFSIVDEVYGFYFENEDVANEVRGILFECSDIVGLGSESYCACVTVPNKIAIAENDLETYNIYKSSGEFVNNNEIFKRFYGDVYKQTNLSI